MFVLIPLGVWTAGVLDVQENSLTTRLEVLNRVCSSPPIHPVAPPKKQEPSGSAGVQDRTGQGGGTSKDGHNQSPVSNPQPSVRDRRQERRTIKFDTVSGDDYRRQLSSLGAVLAIHEPSPDNQMLYRIYRDLKHVPVHGQVEDIRELNRKLNRIFWTDSDPKSVGTLAKALGLATTPKAVTAFFPHKLEQELLKKELEFHHVKDEWQIRETIFAVVRHGKGYEVKVESQTLVNDAPAKAAPAAKDKAAEPAPD